MSERNFRKMLENKWADGKFVCVGLDSEIDKIPKPAKLHWIKNNKLRVIDTIVEFNKKIVKATKDLVCAYKPNTAFYEAHGAEGISALKRTIEDIHTIAPDVPVILDAKRADIGNTNAGYVKFAFDYLGADAITVHPYLGAEALFPFLERKDKGVFVLCRTSNSGAGEFQDLDVRYRDHLSHLHPEAEENLLRPLYNYVARNVAKKWNEFGNCGLVVGATYPSELKEIREFAPDLPILIPGIGAQGGDLEKTIAAGKDNRNHGMIINSSRGIIFASSGEDFAEAAREETQRLHDLINQYREKKGGE